MTAIVWAADLVSHQSADRALCGRREAACTCDRFSRGPCGEADRRCHRPPRAAAQQYRTLFGSDPDFIEADRIRDESGCVLRYERTFMRPVLPGHPAG